jgi:hypothetical protein
MALHTKKVDGDGSDGQRLAVDPLLAGEVESVPKHRLPDGPMMPEMAYQIVHDELMFDGNARLNLATFVTTHMEPEAERLMAETFDKNMIDKDEYPQTAELEMRCVNMLSRLWNSPSTDQATGCSTTGSSEAAMLGGLALKPASSLFQTVSEGKFCEVRASANRSRNVRGWCAGTPRRARHAGSGRAARSAQPLGPPLV